jgi:predicted hotdog family 3-hydroxylacyl-ACP dehydratase
MSKVEFTIDQVLPHSGYMRLLEELLEHSATFVKCAVTIRPDSVLCDGVNGVPVWVGMEYMAQTTCAYSGVMEVREGSSPRISLLLGTRTFKTNVDFFPIGARLIVTSELVMRDEDDLAVFNCRILCNDEEWASCDIKAIRPANVHDLIREQRNEQSSQQ